MSVRTLTADERQEMETALKLVQSTQTDFWMALGELEGLLDGVDLDDNRDFEDITVDYLLEMEKED
jgi:hypothetical protein